MARFGTNATTDNRLYDGTSFTAPPPTPRELLWMQRKTEQKIVAWAQDRIARGRRKGYRRTQMSLDQFAALVALAEVGQQALAKGGQS